MELRGAYQLLSIGLAYSWKTSKKLPYHTIPCVTIPFLLCFILSLKAISKGDLMAGFLSVTNLGGR